MSQQTTAEIIEEQSKFQSLVDKALSDSRGIIRGNVMMVEHIPEREIIRAGGIVLARSEKQLAAHDSDRPHFVRVLAVGDDVDSEVYHVGQVMLVPLTAVKYFTAFGAHFGKQFKYKPSENLGIGFITDDQEWMSFDDFEQFDRFMKVFEQ